MRNKSELPESVHLLIAFEEIHQKDPAFIADVRLTNSTVLHSVFWAPGTQIQNLQQFSDIVIFDATYKTNPLDLPLATFIGLDNHGKTLVFASCLISDETASSFQWIMEKFITLCQTTPKTVLNDDDCSIAIAIKDEFPDSSHRLCVWHMRRNITGILGSDLSEFLKDFYHFVIPLLTPE